jgi:hypothetical protein
MRLSSGIDQLERENAHHKTIIKMLLLIGAALVGILFNIYDKQPVMVERTSHGLEIVRPTEFAVDEAHTKAAIALMMRARFNSDAVSPELYLNPKQLVLRDNEQKELKNRSMYQSVIVRAVTIKNDQATVDVDRVLSVGELRSALRTKLRVTFETEQPNELNPYGLLLSLADPVELKEGK